MNKLTLQTLPLEQRQDGGRGPRLSSLLRPAIKSRTSSRGRSFELTLLDGQRAAAVPNLLGEARTTSRRASTKLAGLLEAFADSTLIGIFFELLGGVWTWTCDGLGGLRRAGKVYGRRGAV